MGVTKYTIWVDGVITRRLAATSYTLTGLNPNTEYLIEVASQDAAGNVSEKASVKAKTTSTATDLPFAEEQKNVMEVYTTGGIRVGNSLPSMRGVYVVKQGKETKKIVVD